MSDVTFNFSGTRVLVTGGATGIGLAIATAFADSGAKLVLLDRDQAGLDAAIETLGDGTATGLTCDLADPEDISRAAARVREESGGLDVLVNNAGVGAGKAFVDLTDAELDLNLDVNLRATILLTRELVPGMLEQGHGSVINIASQAAKIPCPGNTHYAASKAGVLAFTMSLAAEIAPTVRVNAICPGMVLTGMMENNIRLTMQNQGLSYQDAYAEWSAGIPMGRMQQPAHIAQGALFLASEAASEITGISLNISGGQTCH